MLIMRDGQKVGELDSNDVELTQQSVMGAIAGGES